MLARGNGTIDDTMLSRLVLMYPGKRIVLVTAAIDAEIYTTVKYKRIVTSWLV